jgi:tetratricopeptide (TPR) repeat protein
VHRNSVLKDIRVKYVMTDFTERNVEYWSAHTSLQPFVEEGLLDYARFDVERDEQLKLVNSGELLSTESVRNPLVLISNYLFDSIPQDAFFVSEGQLFETLITVNTPHKEPDPEDPGILSRAEISYHNNLVHEDYYEDAVWNRLLQDYRQRLPEAAFLFPLAALQCMDYFHRLSSGRMLLLSGDRGYHIDEAILRGQGAPTMVVHGSLSMMVDYQLIGEYCLQQGGQVLHPAHRPEKLNLSAFIFGNPCGGFIETRQAYSEAVEKFGPDDFFTLKSGVERVYEALSLEQLLAFLRLSGWDYKRFCECLPVLKTHLSEISEMQKQELSEAIKQVWNCYLPIGEEDDLAFQLGTLLLEMEFYTEALEFFQHSVRLYGMEAGTAYNMGVSYYGLRQMEKALEYINRALESDAEFDAAKALRIKLQSSFSGQPQ